MKLQKFDGYTFIDGGVCAAQGFLANGIQCGLAHKALSEDAPSPTAGKKKNDLAVIYAENPCAAAAVYTTRSAPCTFSGLCPMNTCAPRARTSPSRYPSLRSEPVTR